MGCQSRFFGGVGQGTADELGDVGVRERVVDVLAVAPTGDQALGVEELEALGDGGHTVARFLRQLGHAALTKRQAFQHAEPGGIAHGAEQGRGPLHHARVGELERGRRWVLVLAGGVIGAFVIHGAEHARPAKSVKTSVGPADGAEGARPVGEVVQLFLT